MMLYDKLTDLDKKTIAAYIYENAPSEEGDLIECPSLNKIETNLPNILKYWNKNKEHLYKLLGENFILTKEISIEVPETRYESTYYEFRRDHQFFCNYLDRFNTAINQAINNRIITAISPLISYYTLKAYFYHLWDPTALMNNALEESFSFVKDEKTYTFNKGMKITRALGKMRELLNYATQEEHNEFCVEHSQMLNTKVLHGELCLSIHPLDYMTMSDNNSDWSSCMSWRDDGCYSSGTIEMMNSQYVVVAYLASRRNELRIFGDHYWNSKKWRQLFIVNDDLLMGIKGYPYCDKELEATVLEWLRELAIKNLDFTYYDSLFTTEHHEYNRTSEGVLRRVRMQFETNGMYNDCMAVEHQFYLSSPDIFDHSNYNCVYKRSTYTADYCFNYSGEHTCAFCGAIFDWDTDGGERYRLCPNCESYGIICCECGNHIQDEDNVYYFSYRDEPYCRYCFEASCATEHILDDSSFHIADINCEFCARYDENDKDYQDWYNASYKSREQYDLYYGAVRQWDRLFLIDQLRYNPMHGHYYILPEDCTIRGLAHFYGVYSYREYVDMKGDNFDLAKVPDAWSPEWDIPDEEVNINEE